MYEATVIKVTEHLLLIWLRMCCLQAELERKNDVQHDEANRSGAYTSQSSRLGQRVSQGDRDKHFAGTYRISSMCNDEESH